MAHIEKFQQHALGHMLKHFAREKDEEGNHIKYGNQNIDLTRTDLNYNLAPDRGNLYAFILERRKEVYCLKRKDVNLMCSCIVTAPKDLDPAEHERFFRASYDFLAARYGGKAAENVISAYVHMDEGSPHLHFAFIPVCYDKSKERWTVSAKNVVTRQDLKTLHPDLERHVTRELGHDVHVLTGELSNRPNLSIPQYQALQEAKKQLQEVTKNVEDLERSLAALNVEIEPRRAYIDDLAQQQTAVNDGVRERTHLGGRKTYEMDEKKWNEVKMTYADKKAAQETFDLAMKLISDFHSSIAGEKYKKFLQEVDELRERIGRILAKNEIMAGEIDKANEVFEKYPEIQKLFSEKLREIEIEKSHNDDIDLDDCQ